MKHLMKFENFKINEFVGVEEKFDIDEEVLSYVFSDLLDKYTYLGIKFNSIDNKNFNIEVFDSQPTDENHDLEDEFSFLKTQKVYSQIKAHFDVMDFSIKSCEYDRKKIVINFTIHQLS